MGKLVWAVIGLVLFGLGFPNKGGSNETGSAWILREITPDGPALFYSVNGEIRRELWAVHCHQPLRDCVARAPGLALRLDANLQPWLIAVAGPTTRISIQTRNYSTNTPTLFNHPLDQSLTNLLADERSFVVLEENDKVILRTRTTALDQVTSYLQWISSTTGRTLRDARLWPANGKLNVDAMPRDALERYEILQRRKNHDLRQLVPSTKPQVEFAVRAQGGETFFSAYGTAGY